MTSSDQVEERHQYFSIIFFVYREMRVPNHLRQISPVSVWPLALIICCEVLLNVASTNFTTQRVATASLRAVIWNLSLVLHGHLLVMSWSVGYRWLPPFTKFPFKYKFLSERKRPKLESRPNEITAGSLHPLASNLQLPDLRHGFHGLPPYKNFKDFNIVDFVGDRQCKAWNTSTSWDT